MKLLVYHVLTTEVHQYARVLMAQWLRRGRLTEMPNRNKI